MILSRKFYNRSAVTVAKDLIGCVLVRSYESGEQRRFLITETEGYEGLEDVASHASKGRTKCTEIMFDTAGHIYVYLIYGMYHMLNIVTGKKGDPGAVLIRGLQPLQSLPRKTDGPARSRPFSK